MKILFSLCFYFIAVCSFAQTSIVWERTLGGSKRESGYSITLTKDGGSVVCIEAESDDGDVIKAGDYADFWIVKLSKDGIIQWRKSFEGNGYDLPTSIIESIDGGLVVCGGTHIVENETVNWAGNWDAWVIKLNFIGELEWESKFGGRYNDGANAITNSLNSISFVGTVTTNPITGYDAWIVNMLPNGTFNWSKTLTGNQNEIFSNVKQTNDNGLLCVGYTASTTGDFGNGFGNEDGL